MKPNHRKALQQITNFEPVVKTTISLPPAIHRQGKAAAKRDGRSFSNFISRLIEADQTATVSHRPVADVVRALSTEGSLA